MEIMTPELLVRLRHRHSQTESENEGFAASQERAPLPSSLQTLNDNNKLWV